MSEKKWYAVYTRPRWEKKVAELLTKRDIENYCPLNRIQKQWADRKKWIMEPLFNCYVFVRVTEKDHLILKKTDGVVNLVYWIGKPAVIRDVEIDMIRRFLKEHQTVSLQKTPVDVNNMVRVISGPLMDQEGQVVGVKNKTVRVILPSLRYMMAAEIETTNIEVIDKNASYTSSPEYQLAAK